MSFTRTCRLGHKQHDSAYILCMHFHPAFLCDALEQGWRPGIRVCMCMCVLVSVCMCICGCDTHMSCHLQVGNYPQLFRWQRRESTACWQHTAWGIDVLSTGRQKVWIKVGKRLCWQFQIVHQGRGCSGSVNIHRLICKPRCRAVTRWLAHPHRPVPNHESSPSPWSSSSVRTPSPAASMRKPSPAARMRTPSPDRANSALRRQDYLDQLVSLTRSSGLSPEEVKYVLSALTGVEEHPTSPSRTPQDLYVARQPAGLVGVSRAELTSAEWMDAPNHGRMFTCLLRVPGHGVPPGY